MYNTISDTDISYHWGFKILKFFHESHSTINMKCKNILKTFTKITQFKNKVKKNAGHNLSKRMQVYAVNNL